MKRYSNSDKRHPGKMVSPSLAWFANHLSGISFKRHEITDTNPHFQGKALGSGKFRDDVIAVVACGFVVTLFGQNLNAASIEQQVTKTHQKAIEATVYPKGKALVHERRTVMLRPGTNKLVFVDIPSSIIKDSVLFRDTNDPNQELKLVEYTLKSGPISSQLLLENAIDQEILVLPSAGLSKDTLKGTLLGLDGKRAVVKVMDHVQSVPQESIAYAQLPQRMSTQPELIIKVESPKVKETETEIVYLTDGLSWDAAYTVVIHQDANMLDLNSWINFHNDSGVELKKAHLKFADAPSSTDKTGGQTFKIDRPTTVADRTSKSVAWVDRDNIKTTKNYRIYPQVKIDQNEEGVVMRPPVETWLSVKNDKDNQLGIPLPAGIIKVYRRDGKNNLTYVGENKTASLSTGEELSLRLSTTPDITADMWQTDFRKLGEQVIETGYRMDIKNTSKQSQKVTVVQNMSDKSWMILRETHPHKDKNAKQAIWEIDLPAEGSESLRYRVRQNLIN